MYIKWDISHSKDYIKLENKKEDTTFCNILFTFSVNFLLDILRYLMKSLFYIICKRIV